MTLRAMVSYVMRGGAARAREEISWSRIATYTEELDGESVSFMFMRYVHAFESGT